MATKDLRLDANVPGPWYIDNSCLPWLRCLDEAGPDTENALLHLSDDESYVFFTKQPQTNDELAAAGIRFGSLSAECDRQRWKRLTPRDFTGFSALRTVGDPESCPAPLSAQLVNLMSQNGQTYCVLAGVHRANVLWYNKKILEKQGITIGETLTFQEFLAAAEKLKAAGVTPLAVGDSGIWTSTCLLENCLLGNLHASGWIGLGLSF